MKMGRTKITIAILAGVIVLGLLGLEGAYRLYKLSKYGMVDPPNFYTVGVFMPDPVYGKVPQKNFKFENLDPRIRNPQNGVQGFDKRVSFNSLGYRGKEFAAQKSPHTYRIVILGEASTLGLECDDTDTWPVRLEAKIQSDSAFLARHDVTRVEVINGASIGWRSREGLLRLEREAVKFDPDVIMVAFHRSDAYKAMQGYDPAAPILPVYPGPSAIFENLRIRYWSYRSKDTERYEPMTAYLRHDAPWVQAYVNNILAMRRLAEGVGAHFVLVNLPGASRNEDVQSAEYKLIIEKNILTPERYKLWANLQSFMSDLVNHMGNQNHILVVAVDRYFERFENLERIKLFAEMGHPSPAGSEKIAEALYSARAKWE